MNDDIDTDDGDRPIIKLGHEICRPNTLFREELSGDVWRLNAWTPWAVTLSEWETQKRAVYPLEEFERAVASGQFEKIPSVFDLDPE